MIDRRAHGFRGIAATPKRHADPATDLDCAVARFDPADADEFAIQRDDERGLAVLAVGRSGKFFGVLGAIRMRNPGGIFCNAAVASKARNGFAITAARGAQYQPFGLQNGNASLFGSLREDLRRVSHRLGSCE
jgi:hypothetical protein